MSIIPQGAAPQRGVAPAQRSSGALGEGESLLEVRRLSLRFGGIQALQDVDLTVAAQELISVIGPNGAGKTSLFNCMCGLYHPQSGSIRFRGEPLRGLSPDQIARRGMARTFQNIELFRQMTALDNLLLGRHIHFRSGFLAAALGLPSWRRDEVRHRRRAEEILDLLDLQSARKRRVAALPYGQQKLVELGRALAAEPRLLLLDEPSAGMTADEKEDLVFKLRDIQAELGVAMVLVEHDLRMVMEISQRVIVLDRGRVIAAGTPEDVQQDPGVIRAYLGEEGMNTA